MLIIASTNSKSDGTSIIATTNQDVSVHGTDNIETLRN